VAKRRILRKAKSRYGSDDLERDGEINGDDENQVINIYASLSMANGRKELFSLSYIFYLHKL
jgi:hypothetical protein